MYLYNLFLSSEDRRLEHILSVTLKVTLGKLKGRK